MTRFFVPGWPVSQGSKHAAVTKSGKAVMWETTGAKLRPWRETIARYAQATGLRIPAGQAVIVALEFAMPRPKGHYGTGRNAGELRPSAPRHHTTKPDADKLARAALDAFTKAGIYHDDNHVVRLIADKVYADGPEGPGVWVCIEQPPL